MGGLRIWDHKHHKIGLLEKFSLANVRRPVGLLGRLAIVIAKGHAKAAGPSGDRPTDATHSQNAQACAMDIHPGELVKGPSGPLTGPHVAL